MSSYFSTIFEYIERGLYLIILVNSVPLIQLFQQYYFKANSLFLDSIIIKYNFFYI
jgi:hypothetical protein